MIIVRYFFSLHEIHEVAFHYTRFREISINDEKLPNFENFKFHF
jgi:hypothetical protein